MGSRKSAFFCLILSTCFSGIYSRSMYTPSRRIQLPDRYQTPEILQCLANSNNLTPCDFLRDVLRCVLQISEKTCHHQDEENMYPDGNPNAPLDPLLYDEKVINPGKNFRKAPTIWDLFVENHHIPHFPERGIPYHPERGIPYQPERDSVTENIKKFTPLVNLGDLPDTFLNGEKNEQDEPQPISQITIDNPSFEHNSPDNNLAYDELPIALGGPINKGFPGPFENPVNPLASNPENDEEDFVTPIYRPTESVPGITAVFGPMTIFGSERPISPNNGFEPNQENPGFEPAGGPYQEPIYFRPPNPFPLRADEEECICKKKNKPRKNFENNHFHGVYNK